MALAGLAVCVLVLAVGAYTQRTVLEQDFSRVNQVIFYLYMPSVQSFGSDVLSNGHFFLTLSRGNR